MLDEFKIVMVAKDRYKKDKLVGVDAEIVGKFKKYANIVLVEADGARQRPFKTHMPHEPVIPAATDKVIMVIGSEIVHQPLNDETVHRAELFAKKWNMALGAKLTRKIIAKELLSTAGYTRKIPLTSNVAIFLNKFPHRPISRNPLSSGLNDWQLSLISLPLQKENRKPV